MASLEQFYKQLADRKASQSFYRPAGQAILATPWASERASPVANFGASIAQGLLGGFLNNQAKKEEAQYKADLADVLRGTLSGRSVLRPSVGQDDMALISAFKLVKDIERQEKLQEIEDTITLEERKARAGKRGELGVYQEMLNQGSGAASGSSYDFDKTGDTFDMRPDAPITPDIPSPARSANIDKLRAMKDVNPLAKGIVEAEDKFSEDKRKDQEYVMSRWTQLNPYRDYKDVESNFTALQDLALKNTRGSDYLVLRALAKIGDPGGVVNEGEAKGIVNTRSMVSALGKDVDSILNGTSAFTRAEKLALLEAAADIRNARAATLEGERATLNDYLLARKAGTTEDIGIKPISAWGSEMSQLAQKAAKQEYQELLQSGVPKEKAQAQIKGAYGRYLR